MNLTGQEFFRRQGKKKENGAWKYISQPRKRLAYLSQQLSLCSD